VHHRLAFAVMNDQGIVEQPDGFAAHPQGRTESRGWGMHGVTPWPRTADTWQPPTGLAEHDRSSNHRDIVGSLAAWSGRTGGRGRPRNDGP